MKVDVVVHAPATAPSVVDMLRTRVVYVETRVSRIAFRRVYYEFSLELGPGWRTPPPALRLWRKPIYCRAYFQVWGAECSRLTQ